jgi:DNA replication protein DnaC
MLNEPTMDKLRVLGLDGMAAAWLGQHHKPEIGSLAFDERFGLLVDAEWDRRQTKRLDRRLKEAKLKFGNACLENVDYGPRRQLDKALVRQLAGCRWIEQHHNLVINGATGTGKTYLACAFAQQACRQGYRVLYRRAPRLSHELTLARADGTYVRCLAKLARFDVLIIDDWGLAALGEQERRDFLEIIEDRSELHSTLLTSQLPVAQWHDHIGDPTIADAVCDRLLHNAYRLVLKGPSRRKEATPTES